MPFRSRAQQGYLFATNPALAREFANETEDYASLPDKITDSDPVETRKRPKPVWKPKASRKKAAAVLAILGADMRESGPGSQQNCAPPKSEIERLAERVYADTPLQKTANEEIVRREGAGFQEQDQGAALSAARAAWQEVYGRYKVAAGLPWRRVVSMALHSLSNQEIVLPPDLEKWAFVTAQPQSTSVPMQQAQQAMGKFLPQRPQQRQLGLPSLASGGPQTGLPVGGQKATAVPGMEGTAAANPIDMHGPLDPTGLALDGNHAAGVRKGFKIAGAVDRSTRRLAHAVLEKLAVDRSTAPVSQPAAVDQSTRLPQEKGAAVGRSTARHTARPTDREQCDIPAGTRAASHRASEPTQLQKLAAVLASPEVPAPAASPIGSDPAQPNPAQPGDPNVPNAPARRAVIVKGNPQFIDGNPAAEQFYAQLEAMLKEQGYGDVSYDPGEPYTEPPQADLWLGHSRGADRLRFAPEGTATIAMGSRAPGAINHPGDDLDTPFHEVGGEPPAAHYELNEDMKNELFTKLAAVSKYREKESSNAMIGGLMGGGLGAAVGGGVGGLWELISGDEQRKQELGWSRFVAPVATGAAIGGISGGLRGALKGSHQDARAEGAAQARASAEANAARLRQRIEAAPKPEPSLDLDFSTLDKPLPPLEPKLTQEEIARKFNEKLFGATPASTPAPTSEPPKVKVRWSGKRWEAGGTPVDMSSLTDQADRVFDERGLSHGEGYGRNWRNLFDELLQKRYGGYTPSFGSDGFGGRTKANALIEKLGMALNPFAADPPAAEKKKRKATLPWLGLGLGAAGAGAYGLAQGIASNEQVDRLQTAAKNYDPRAFTDPKNFLPPNRTGLTYYQETLSPAAQLNPFGKPVGEALVNLRSDPDLMEFLGTQDYALLDEKAQNGVGGLAHYRSFANGPVNAYAHQLKARLHGTPVPETLGVPAGTMYSDWMGRKFEDFVANQTGQRINPFEVDTKFMPHEEQVALMQKFHASMSPEEQAFRLQSEDPGPGYATQTSNYLPKAEGLIGGRNFLKDVGVGLGGAGLGAVGGHILYDVLRDKKEKEKSWLGQAASSAAGAALGGGAAYLGGTDSGRELLGQGIRALKRGLLGLPKQAEFLESPQGYAAAARVMGVAA